MRLDLPQGSETKPIRILIDGSSKTSCGMSIQKNGNIDTLLLNPFVFARKKQFSKINLSEMS